MGPTAGTISRTARVSVVRLNLKEGAGKTPARRTGIAYEAVMSDEKANICAEGMVVYAAGISVKVGVHYPGRSVYLPSATVIERWQDG